MRVWSGFFVIFFCSTWPVLSIANAFSCFDQCRDLLVDASRNTGNVASIKPLITSKSYPELDAVISAECVIINRAKNCTENCERHLGQPVSDEERIKLYPPKAIACDKKNKRVRKKELRCFIQHRPLYTEECGRDFLIDYERSAHSPSSNDGMEALAHLDYQCRQQEKAMKCISTVTARICGRDVLRLQAEILEAAIGDLRHYETSKMSPPCDKMLQTADMLITANHGSTHSLICKLNCLPFLLSISVLTLYL